MRRNTAPALTLIVLAIFCAPFLGRSRAIRKLRTPGRQQAQQPPNTIDGMPIVAQSIEGGIWRTDGTFQSVMMLKNILEPLPITMTPVLYMADGTEYDLPQVTLDAAGVAMVNVNTALENAPPNVQSHRSSYGSAAIKYQWAWAQAVVGAVRVSDDVRSLIYVTHIRADAAQVHDPGAPQTQQEIQSTWWKQEPDVTGFLFLTNTSTKPLSASVQISNSDGSASATQPVDLAPHQSSFMDLQPLWAQLPSGASQGAIKIFYTGVTDAIVAEGGLEDDAKGYSAMLHMAPKLPQGSAQASPETISFDSTGLMVGAQDPDMQFPQGTRFLPYLVLRNTTPQPLQVRLDANYMNNATPHEVLLGNISLGPNVTQQVDMNAVLKSAGLASYNGYMNLRVSFPGPVTNLQEESGSVDQTLTYVFEVPPSRETWSNSQIINYWNTAGDTDTMITLWNFSPWDEDVVLTFFHHQGQYKLPVHMPAHASTTMNISSLIKSGTPDAQGRTIPTNVTQGSIKLSGPWGDSDRIHVKVYVGIFNVRTGTCSYACLSCNGVICNWTEPPTGDCTPGDPPPSGNIDFEAGPGDYDWVTAKVKHANLIADDVTSDVGFAEDDNNNLVTVDSEGKVTAVAIGNTSIVGEVDYLANGTGNHQYCGDPWGQCGTYPANFNCDIEVDPVIDNITPAQQMVNTTLAVTLNGVFTTPVNGIDGGSAITATVGSVTSSAVQATFSVSSSASGVVAISITANGATSESWDYYVQVPTHLVRITEPCTPNGGVGPPNSGTNITVYDCNGNLYQNNTKYQNLCGGYQWFSYSVQDQRGTSADFRITNGTVTLTESFTNISPPNDMFPNPNDVAASATINLNGSIMNDLYGLFVKAPSCPPTNSNDSFDQNFTATIGATVYNVATVIHITRATDNTGLPTFTSTITTQ